MWQHVLLLLIIFLFTARGQERLWTRMTGTSNTDSTNSIALDSNSGALYVTGAAAQSLHGETWVGSDDIFLMKYDVNGTRIWTKMVGTTGSDLGLGVSVNSATGAIYITGQAGGSLHGEAYAGSTCDVIVMMFASNGTRIWTRLFGSAGGDIGQGISADPNAMAVYVTGYVAGSINGQTYIGSADAFLVKYATDGTNLWTKLLGTTGTDVGYGVAFDSVNGDVYVTGTLGDSLDLQPFNGALDIFVSRFDSNGNRMWTRMSGGVGVDITYALAVDGAAGTVYICGGATSGLDGETYADVSSFDMVVIKYLLKDGSRVWTKMAGTSSTDLCQGIAVNTLSGVVYAVGYAGNSIHAQANAGLSDMAVISYASNGTRQWTKLFGSATTDRAQGVTISPEPGKLFVAGMASGSLDGELYLGQTDNVVISYSIPSSQPSSQPTMQPSVQPSRQPSSQPSRQPTSQPSIQPSSQPVSRPSTQPSMQPSSQPSGQPSTQPSVQPSSQPVSTPTSQPTTQPTIQPSRQPTSQPSTQPTSQPAGKPSGQPSVQPSSQPSCQPSSQPSSQPSGQPSLQPVTTPTAQPSTQPSMQPSRQPTCQPSAQPSRQPVDTPSCQPSVQPSNQPSGQPSSQPSIQPSSQPSIQPTGQPSSQPSMQPSTQPISTPSTQPSTQPSMQPFRRPTGQPTGQPSVEPSSLPSCLPSGQPSVQPSVRPLSNPSCQPSAQPSMQPLTDPSSQPTRQPTLRPSGHPSVQPSIQPSSQPLSAPTDHPSSLPSSQPSCEPSNLPTCRPSIQPSSQPSCQPSGQPSAQPSSQPRSSPSGQPSIQPLSFPSGQPSAQPSSLPSMQPPSGRPLSQPTGQPSKQPSSQPSRQPTGKPSHRLVSHVSPSPSFSLSVSCMPTTTSALFPLASNASLALGILTRVVNSSTSVAIVTDTIRLVSQVLPNVSVSSSISVSLPLTDAERALQAAGNLALPYINLVTSNMSSGTSLYVVVAVLSSTLWVPLSASGNLSSSNTSNVGQLLSDVVTVVTVGEGVSFVDIGFPAGTISHYNSTPPINFTIYCPPRYIIPKSFYCNDTGYIERVQCNGLASVVRGTCPRLQEACAALDLASMTVARDNLCQTTRSNSTNSTNGNDLLCRCTLGEGMNVAGSNMIAAGVVLGLGTSDLSKTFQASSSFGDGSAASKAAIVLSVFASVWGVAFFSVIYFYNWSAHGTKHTDKAKHAVDALMKESLDSRKLNDEKIARRRTELMQKLTASYVTVLFPAVFQPSSLLEGLCREVYGKHMYINFFFRLHCSHNPIVDIVKVVTLQSFLLFLLALLYDLNVPSDDGSCKGFTSQPSCLERRLFFDPSQTYCQWTAFQYAALLNTDDDAVYFECVYGDPVVSLTAATYTSMIMSLATCLIMDPLEYILSLLAVPTLSKPPASQLLGADAKPVLPQHVSLDGTVSASSMRILPADLVLVSSDLSSVMTSVVDVNPTTQKEAVANQHDVSIEAARFYRAELLEAAVLAYRSRLLFSQSTSHVSSAETSRRLALFDRAWGLDSATGAFLEASRKSRHRWRGRRKVSPKAKIATSNLAGGMSMHVVIQEELLAVQQDTLAVMDELVGRSQAEVGFEIAFQFVRDVLGRNTAAAHIFALKVDMDCEKLQRVSWALKASICFLLLCLNGLFFYFTILRGISKGLAWQRSYLIAWLLQSSVDICVFETMQVAWFHYFIPSLVKKEVARARRVFEDTSVKAVSGMHRHPSVVVGASGLNAPDYLFVSNHLARQYPQCVESFLIRHYRSPVPVNTVSQRHNVTSNESSDSWTGDDVESNRVTDKEQGADHTDSSKTSSHVILRPLHCSQRFLVYLSSAAVSVLLQLVVAAPLELQSLLIRAIEPVILSGVLFVFLLVSTRPVFLVVTIVLLASLVGSMVWEHVSKARKCRQVASSTADVLHTPAAAVLASPDLPNIIDNEEDASYSLGSISGDFSSDYSSSHRDSDQNQKDDDEDEDEDEDSVADQVRAPTSTSYQYYDDFMLDEAYSMSSSDSSSLLDD